MRRYVRSAVVYQFVFAQNGVEALERLREDEEIVIVLSDINMPKMDGLALLDQIPKVNPNIRSVIISAYGDMKNIRTAMNRGAFDFVTKPVDFDDLKLTIDRTLQQLLEWRDALGARDRLVALENELDVASQMQQSILPKRFPQGSRVRGICQHETGAFGRRETSSMSCALKEECLAWPLLTCPTRVFRLRCS